MAKAVTKYQDEHGGLHDTLAAAEAVELRTARIAAIDAYCEKKNVYTGDFDASDFVVDNWVALEHIMAATGRLAEPHHVDNPHRAPYADFEAENDANEAPRQLRRVFNDGDACPECKQYKRHRPTCTWK